MKRTAYLLSVLFLAICLVGPASGYSQTKENQKREKLLEKELKSRAIKEARKEAKKYTKAGWSIFPGAPPMDKQLEKSWEQQLMSDDKGYPVYITADGNAIAGNESAASMQAVELAKLQLAGLLETRIASLVSANIANTELSAQEAESITEVVQSAKNIIAQELGYVNPLFKIKRRLKNGNVEVSTRVFYNTEEGMSIAKKRIKEELKEKVKTNEEDLRKLMGM